jgi:hypothetical protein
MGIFLVKDGIAESVVNSNQPTDQGVRFDRLGDPVFSQDSVFFGALAADGTASFFSVFGGKIIQFGPPEMPARNVAEAGVAGRHSIEVVSVSINQRGQIAYLGSP